MNSLAEVQYTVQFETEAQIRSLQAERQQARWEWWMAQASVPRRARGLGIRQAAVGLGDFLAGLRCQLQHRFASEPVAPAC